MISVIVIARNEEKRLPLLLMRLRTMPAVSQVIVSDGGSSDNTIDIARSAGAEIVHAQGRGAQLNAGAQLARGEVLWFLHADCLPSQGCGRQISRAIKRGVEGGHFRLKFASRSPWARLFELVARVQSRVGVFYGDSGIFVAKSVFEELGGFAAWPLFEDLDFARKLARRGRATTRPGRLYASARRFEKRPLKTLFVWIELQLRFELGQSPEKLAHLYRERF